MNYNTVTLASLCYDRGSYGIPASAVDYSVDLPTYLRITDINDDGTINFLGLKSVDHPDASRYLLSPNDIVFARTGASTGRNYFYDGKDGNFVYAGFLIKFSINPEKINPLFIKYYCQSQDYYDWVSSFNTGSTRGNINAVTLASMPIPKIDRDLQELIVQTLTPLDEKIKQNNSIIANLEAQAQAVFKSWFVDFEPFNGEPPVGWSSTTLDSLCLLVSRGITPRYSEDTSQIVINQKCIRNHKIDLGESRSHTPVAKNEKWLQYGDVVINSTGQGTLGRVAQVYFSLDNITADSHVTIVRPKRRNLTSYLGQWTISKEDEIESMASGSTGQTELSRERVKAMTLFEPDNSVLDAFANIIEPMTAMIQKKQEENATLALTRDTLLPKLMSGEIEVPVEG